MAEKRFDVTITPVRICLECTLIWEEGSSNKCNHDFSVRKFRYNNKIYSSLDRIWEEVFGE